MMNRLFCLIASLAVVGFGAPANADVDDGTESPSAEEHEGFFVELAAGTSLRVRDDPFADTLRTFGFSLDDWDIGTTSALLGRQLVPNLSLAVAYFDLDDADYTRRNGTLRQWYRWDSEALGGFVQTQWSIPATTVSLMLRLGLGATFVTSRFDEVVVDADYAQTGQGERTVTRTQVDHGLWYGGGAGITWMPFRYFGFLVEVRAVRAAGLDNRLAQAHELGGLSFLIGLRGATWEG